MHLGDCSHTLLEYTVLFYAVNFVANITHKICLIICYVFTITYCILLAVFRWMKHGGSLTEVNCLPMKCMKLFSL